MDFFFQQANGGGGHEAADHCPALSFGCFRCTAGFAKTASFGGTMLLCCPSAATLELEVRQRKPTVSDGGERTGE